MDFSFNGHQLCDDAKCYQYFSFKNKIIWKHNEVNLMDILCLIMIHKIYFLMKSICNAHVKTWEIY